MKIFPKDSIITASLYENEKWIKTKVAVSEVKEKSPNSSTHYYLKNNQVNTFSITRNPEMELEGVDTNDLSFQIFSIFPIMINSLDAVMNKFIDVGKSGNFDHFTELNQGTFFPFSKHDYLSSLEYDEKGNAGFGIKISQEKNGEILLEGVEDSQVKKSMKVKSIADLTANNKKVLEDFMHRLLNE
ncbi:hypothetical protein [Niabella ginsengisoli]|uniref:Uncharacterized protein n=1 Tax=Niabella ginsengisoli TaxID=522298 RepID=A0ABS9SLH3_9BACT|nr:hypothetical protein [Niabella ginsengisoli]MCH5599192.1 hypothetical protein [Niabella ginsengisoli]